MFRCQEIQKLFKNRKLFKSKIRNNHNMIHEHKVITCNLTNNKKFLKLQKNCKTK